MERVLKRRTVADLAQHILIGRRVTVTAKVGGARVGESFDPLLICVDRDFLYKVSLKL